MKKNHFKNKSVSPATKRVRNDYFNAKKYSELLNKLCNENIKNENSLKPDTNLIKTSPDSKKTLGVPKNRTKDRFFFTKDQKLQNFDEKNQENYKKFFISEVNTSEIQTEGSQIFPVIRTFKQKTNVYKAKRKSVPVNTETCLNISTMSTTKRNSLI